jgi:hypothetical protein
MLKKAAVANAGGGVDRMQQGSEPADRAPRPRDPHMDALRGLEA